MKTQTQFTTIQKIAIATAITLITLALVIEIKNSYILF